MRKGHDIIEREVVDWNPQDNGKERGLNRRGGDRSTTRHYEKERAGVKLSSWPEIGSDGDVLLTPYVPKGITGYAAADDDDDDDM